MAGAPQPGGCLCGDVRYEAVADPLWVTVCFCRFCQRGTGGQGLVEPIFDRPDVRFTRGNPKIYTHVSTGSGKTIDVHFCATCGTKLCLTFERWPDRLGVFAGTFDDPNWFEFSPDNSKYIFVSSAARGTLVPAGYKVFQNHAATETGEPLDPEVLSEVLHVR